MLGIVVIAVTNGSQKRRALAPESVMVFVVTNGSPKSHPKGYPRAVREIIRKPSVSRPRTVRDTRSQPPRKGLRIVVILVLVVTRLKPAG